MISCDFTDKVVAVTGAGCGIGEGVARTYAKYGAKVILAERDENAGRKIEAAICETGGAKQDSYRWM